RWTAGSATLTIVPSIIATAEPRIAAISVSRWRRVTRRWCRKWRAALRLRGAALRRDRRRRGSRRLGDRDPPRPGRRKRPAARQGALPAGQALRRGADAAGGAGVPRRPAAGRRARRRPDGVPAEVRAALLAARPPGRLRVDDAAPAARPLPRRAGGGRRSRVPGRRPGDRGR